MAWTAPMTAVSGNIWTEAQFNTHVRDNLLETAPAKATTVGSIFVSTGSNSIAERLINQDFITSAQATTSTSYTDLGTVGPSITVTTGPSALVIWAARVYNNTADRWAMMSVQVSGATSISPNDDWIIGFMQNTSNNTQWIQGGHTKLFTGLTPGSNTFTAKYRTVTSGTATFDNRHMMVIPF